MSSNPRIYQRSITQSTRAKTAPALALYLDSGYDPAKYRVFVDHTSGKLGIYNVDNIASDRLFITLQGKTIKRVVSEIEEADYKVSAVVLQDTGNIAATDWVRVGGDPDEGGTGVAFSSFPDLSNDGAAIIRLYGHGVHYQEETRIRLMAPYPGDSLVPWYARVQSGVVSKEENGIIYTFSIPEYDSQTWSLKYGKPYMDVYGERAELLSEKVIKLRKAPIFYEKNNIKIEIDKKAFNSAKIEDVDRWNGYIYSKERLPSNGEIAITYSYQERSFIYKDLNLNASAEQNLSLLGSTVLFYLVPWKSTDGVERRKCVRHVLGSTVQDAIGAIPDYGFPILLLGAIYVRETNVQKDISLIDTRSRGGGLYEEDVAAEVAANMDLSFLWDVGVWDGVPIPGSSAIVMSVPDSRYAIFNPKDIKSRASKFLSAGVLPIMDRINNDDPKAVGETQSISLFNNGDFSKGSDYWMGITPSVPLNFTGVTTGDIPSFNISGNYLKLSPGENVVQRYLKTSAPAVITYEVQSSSDGINYSSWNEERIVDDRVTSGFMLGGTLKLSSDYEYRNYRNVKVHAAYTPSYDAQSDIYDEIIKEVNVIKDLSNSGRIVTKITNLNKNTREAVTWGPSPTDAQVAMINLWPDPNVTGYLIDLGDAILDGLFTDSNGVTFPSLYSTQSGWYKQPDVWYDWTNSVTYLSRLYAKSQDTKYFTGAKSIVDGMNTINPYEADLTNVLIGLADVYTIPSEFRWDGTEFETRSLTLTSGNGAYGEVDLSMIDTDKFLNGARAYIEYDQNGTNAFRAIVSAISSASQFAAPVYGGNFSGTWAYQGNYFSGHSYYSFDHLGKTAGHNLKLASEIYLKGDTAAIPIITTDLLPAIEDMSNTLLPTLTGAAAKGGYLPAETTELVSAMANMVLATDSLALPVRSLVKGMIDDIGLLEEVSSFQQRKTYINRKPPAKLLEMFGSILDRPFVRAKIPESRALAEMIFRHNKYLYADPAGRGYAEVTTNPGLSGGYENTNLKGLIELYTKWST